MYNQQTITPSLNGILPKTTRMPKSEVVRITPKIAEDLLKLNSSNRKVSERAIRSYVKQMETGEWKFTGDPIQVSKTNKLLNGQHRLMAIIKSQLAFDFVIISDLDDDVFNVLDTGKNRSAADVLSVNGVENFALVSSISKFIINYRKGNFESASKFSAKDTLITNSNVEKFVESNPEIIDVALTTKEYCKKFKLIAASTMGAMYFLFQEKDSIKVNQFFDKLVYGLNLEKGCPIRALRDRMIQDSVNKSKLKPIDKVALIVSSWNNFRAGKSITMLKGVENISKIA
jgi:hypothetical protein